jgi:uncharacterized delta-60 repeat protein
MHIQDSKQQAAEHQQNCHPCTVLAIRFLVCWLSMVALALFGQPTNFDFNVKVNIGVYTLAIQPDGKIVVAGTQSPLRLNADGMLDTTFSPVVSGPFSGTVVTMAVQEDGKILAGGRFTTINAQTHTNIARFTSDGSLDPIFNIQTIQNIGLGGTVYCFAFEPGGTKLFGGLGFHLQGQSFQGLARLDAFDASDSTFDAGPNDRLYALAVQPDGKILASGQFTTLAGAPSGSIARLNSDGTIDPDFSALGVQYASCMAGEADGRILVGTPAVTANGVTVSNLVRLHTDGSLDTNFNTYADPNLVVALAVQCDGKILVGGRFTSLGGQPRKGLGRVNPDGTVDMTFVPTDYDAVLALGLDSDGKILVGGRMVDASGKTNNYVGRLQNTGPATANLFWDGSAITWMRGGTAPEIWWASFQVSTNGTDWTELGPGQRISGGWRLVVTNQYQIQPGTVIRASGAVSVGQFNGTAWFVQSYLPITSSLAIINDGNLGFNSEGFGFNFAAPASSTVVIERSTDLQNWTPTATNMVLSSPSRFVDPGPVSPNHFYRLRLAQ